MDKPQIICHNEKSVTFSIYDGKWVPCSAKFVIMGSRPNSKGVLQLYEMTSGDPQLIKEIDKDSFFKCGTFDASSLRDRYLATGNDCGQLQLWDLENLSKPVYEVTAHEGCLNCIDGVAGQSIGCGAPEIVTGGRDGIVKLWDPRQQDPVTTLEPNDANNKRDCWTVALGNSYNNSERAICAGYDNGDIKLVDLRKMALRWDTNVKNGVCSLQFDRKEIEMNKLVATTLESKFFLFDLRTQHPKKGFAVLKEKAHESTVWGVSHLPQNREIFMTCGGNGTVYLWKYNYPEKRTRPDGEGVNMGVVGELSLLQNYTLSSQPISTFHWSSAKQGLALATSFDQTFRIVFVTKLHLI
ncbi:dynein axonemal assembly factor 10 [Rhodnius prolixus]|uniref:WD_REPEATS_REGION domain-containing protein n=1 Tax=Rhodnius prolixus TaxID=13249 RepID=R4FNM7_RHOPR